MYVVELRFALAGNGAPPSPEVVEASVRRHSAHGAGHIEHLRVVRVHDDIHVVSFTVAKSRADAGTWGQAIGRAVAVDLRHARFRGFRIWPAESFGPPESAG
jgi:hypothetical protein